MAKKTTACALLFVIALFWASLSYAEEASPPPAPDIKAKHAVLMDAATGRILYEKDADTQAFPASTTKLMTAVLAAEALDRNTVLTASKQAVDIELDASSLGIKEGEQFTVEQLMYALLVHSANDAANILAEAAAGDIPTFVEQMNTGAGELGMNHTHFTNTHGYQDNDHYTTARDLATLMRYAMDNELVRTVLETPEYTMPPTNLSPDPKPMINTNSMITAKREYGYVYTPIKGGKTGHTSDAGYCFAAFGEKDHKLLVSVVLGSVYEEGINYSFYDTKKLVDYGFDNFSMKPVIKVNEIVESAPVKWGKGSDQTALLAQSTLETLLLKTEDAGSVERTVSITPDLAAPLEKGTVAGSVEYNKDGVFLGKVDLVVSEDVKLDVGEMIFGSIADFLKRPYVWGSLCALVVLLIIVRIVRRRIRRRRRRVKRRNYRY